MGCNPQECLENTVNTMGTLLGVQPIVPWISENENTTDYKTLTRFHMTQHAKFEKFCPGRSGWTALICSLFGNSWGEAKPWDGTKIELKLWVNKCGRCVGKSTVSIRMSSVFVVFSQVQIWIQAPTAASSTDLQLTRLVNIVSTQTPSYTKHLPFHISAASWHPRLTVYGKKMEVCSLLRTFNSQFCIAYSRGC